MKRKVSDLSEREVATTLDALYTAVSSLKGRDAMKAFLRDLLTPSERVMLGRRIIIARMIVAGESYDSIGERLHVGRNTIGKVHKWLQDQIPGFENALKGLEKEFSNRQTKNSAYASVTKKLKKKYPLHFLFFRN
ncbi:MAG: hypothetical protein COV01_01110 [Candidatus Taylorbacteria bacterium CG10_big_fil_rev_8_21_14_0_10_41_48]|uniref:TrpR like protein, YerC/YecD n=1 Tax=Candidatus Taylorbacteria bacterium CG10_big_fil_rev_8_21_14_0_10_41_48 TaxID=1975024 RepID=A0A2M8LDC2_9BACT|nr:MAG: hypothetical protein COV01_01110 [Candidatus Taylorbacteria bacterium CG10_big_fil_rev_8_21_14_0_10_41_48]